ncbi:MAG: dihydrodipicolinate synthase family protein [Anaerolineae bacterium]|jgi:dihydrodipicolinate synthase/N-acetylneuraminate lyase|nr:dihydrodipicolinate synthase family protein [Anaerolineae bacterium]
MSAITTLPIDPPAMLRPGRVISGISAILLPFHPDGRIDYDGLTAHIHRTAAAGLVPAVNMDTGYASLIDEATRREVLRLTQATLGGGEFVAGAYVADAPGAAFDAAAYQRQIEQILACGGTPILFPSWGLTDQPDEAIIASYQRLAQDCPRFIAFELGTMFVPFGKIYSLEVFAGLLSLPQCLGAKHSSLRRDLEWQRLRLRDALRPSFKVYTGNDLAVDMVMYGSDYLLGLSTFAPDAFARRDALWAAQDAGFYALNDVLQYLGCFTFRAPVPAYRHSAAQFLQLRGWIGSEATPPGAPRRPDSDVPILRDILTRLEALLV